VPAHGTYSVQISAGTLDLIFLRFSAVPPTLYNLNNDTSLYNLVKGKAIPVTGRGGPYGCETSRLPHFLDNPLTDGDESVSLTRRTPFIPREIPGTHFC
jgi:hypothetical protein